jgi:hypothetical protein
MTKMVEVITVEQASSWAVTAMACDLGFWARASAVDGTVTLNDLIRVLDTFRETATDTATPMPGTGSRLERAKIAG